MLNRIHNSTRVKVAVYIIDTKKNQLNIPTHAYYSHRIIAFGSDYACHRILRRAFHSVSKQVIIRIQFTTNPPIKYFCSYTVSHFSLYVQSQIAQMEIP